VAFPSQLAIAFKRSFNAGTKFCKVESLRIEGRRTFKNQVRSAGCSCQAKKFGGSAEALLSKNYQSLFTNCYSLSHQSPIASRYLPFTIRYSPFATRCRFGSAEVSPSQFIPLPSHALRPVLFGAQFLRHQLRVKIRSMNGFDCVTDCGLKIRSMACF
jgi:hypothetical protein